MKDFFKIDSIFVICVSLVIIIGIGGFTHYHVNDRNLMASNIKDAISSGINPMSVRCSYAKTDDAVCVAYSFSGRTPTSGK
jgi:hypothetical protein